MDGWSWTYGLQPYRRKIVMFGKQIVCIMSSEDFKEIVMGFLVLVVT